MSNVDGKVALVAGGLAYRHMYHGTSCREDCRRARTIGIVTDLSSLITPYCFPILPYVIFSFDDWQRKRIYTNYCSW